MRTVALRFADNFAPSQGTIAAHEELIDEFGYVWYGKLGTPLSNKVVDCLMKNDNPKILLIHSGKSNRYWAHVINVQRETPPAKEIPEYYRNRTQDFKCWFCVTKFERADTDVMSRCTVASSGEPLSIVSKSSLSPYFIINYQE